MPLLQRVVGILTDPKATWEAIAEEPDDIAATYRGYIGILAAIPAVALLFGLGISVGFHLGAAGMATAITAAAIGYGISLASVLIAASVISWLAVRFRSQGSPPRAVKLVGYASTPMWIAGVLYVSPTLWPFVFVAVPYAMYLFFAGLPPVMHTPLEQRVPFTVISALIILVVNIVVRSAAAALNLPYYGF